MTLADKKGMLLQPCMEECSSTEFIDWLYFYEEQEKAELKLHSKQDHYFALIALKVQQVLEVLCDVKVHARKALQDMLLQFVNNEEQSAEYKLVKVDSDLPKHDPYKPLPRDANGKLIGGIDTDDPDPLPERWQKVNERAKVAIGAMLGVPLDLLPREIKHGKPAT